MIVRLNNLLFVGRWPKLVTVLPILLVDPSASILNLRLRLEGSDEVTELFEANKLSAKCILGFNSSGDGNEPVFADLASSLNKEHP